MKGFRTEDAKKIFSECETDGFAFDFEVLLTAKSKGMKMDEIPVKIINHRESKINVVSDTFKMLGDLMRIKRRVKEKNKKK
jgi:dolichyl-phosphate beta-glucosyltransferase